MSEFYCCHCRGYHSLCLVTPASERTSDRIEAQEQRVNELGVALGRIENKLKSLEDHVRLALSPVQYVDSEENERIGALTECVRVLHRDMLTQFETLSLLFPTIFGKLDTLQSHKLLKDFQKHEKGVKRGKHR